MTLASLSLLRPYETSSYTSRSKRYEHNERQGRDQSRSLDSFQKAPTDIRDDALREGIHVEPLAIMASKACLQDIVKDPMIAGIA